MKLKDLEKIKLLESALFLGIPLGLRMLGNDPDSTTWREAISQWQLYSTIAIIPRLTDTLLSAKIEPNTEDYKQIKTLYDNIINNLANFFKDQNITDPVEIFAMYQFMYRNGYLSYNHNFNYDMDMKDLSSLNGVDVVRGTGVCRSISSFLTDLYKAMGYDACNLLVSANSAILKNADRQGKYPKWKINKKTKKFIGVISKISDTIPFTNHLITLVEKDEKTYIFDPTNDVFLIKGKNNELILPDQKEGKMKISYFTLCLQKILGQTGNLKSYSQIQQHLEKNTIDYEEYKETYKNSLIYIKNHISLFQEFYENNESLFLELFQKLNEQSDLIQRLYPELYINFGKIIDLLTSKKGIQK